ncbi:MAG: hypothetical protein ACRDJ1_03935 [Actinomycetota bacterium]
MTLAVSVLELSFVILLLAMLGLSGVIGLVVVARIVEPRGLKVLSQRMIGLPRPKKARRP